MKKNVVLSLYDYTGEAVKPWAERGYTCYCFDIQHEGVTVTDYPNGGSIVKLNADLHNPQTIEDIAKVYGRDTAFMYAFPVCTDLAVSGARHFERKRSENPRFQDEAVDYAKWCGWLGDSIGCPYLIENPVSVLSTMWRKPDHIFQPFEYGGYIPETEGKHPVWPEYIAPFDAYSKKTCLWTGGGFKMPEQRPVDCEKYGKSNQWGKLGGKSQKTKNIRSATPRGFATAVCQTHA